MANIFEQLMSQSRDMVNETSSVERKVTESRKIPVTKIKLESRKIFEEEDLDTIDDKFSVDMDNPENDEVVLVIDPELPAEGEEVPEVEAEEMVGDMVYKCPVCGANYLCDHDHLEEEGIEVDDEGTPIACPICGDESDQILVGEIAPAEEVKEEDETELPPQGDETEIDETEEDEVIEDSVKRRPRIGRRKTESKKRRVKTEAKIKNIKRNRPTVTDEQDLDITGATLLTADEAEELPEELLSHDMWWWLKSPGYSSYVVAGVDRDGSIDDLSGRVDYDSGAVRPVLTISNLESSDLKIGDTFEFGGEEFEVISNDKAICWDDIGYCEFRKDWEASDANDYEKSDVKKVVDSWFNQHKGEEIKTESKKRRTKIESKKKVKTEAKRKRVKEDQDYTDDPVYDPDKEYYIMMIDRHTNAPDSDYYGKGVEEAGKRLLKQAGCDTLDDLNIYNMGYDDITIEFSCEDNAQAMKVAKKVAAFAEPPSEDYAMEYDTTGTVTIIGPISAEDMIDMCNGGTSYMDNPIREFESVKKISKSKKRKKVTKVTESLGKDLAKYQMWVDYDMKHYGKISDETNELLKKAGLEIVKDDHDAYEVIAKEGCSIKEDMEDDAVEVVDIGSAEVPEVCPECGEEPCVCDADGDGDLDIIIPEDEEDEEKKVVINTDTLEIDEIRLERLMNKFLHENYKGDLRFKVKSARQTRKGGLRLEYVILKDKKEFKKGSLVSEKLSRIIKLFDNSKVFTEASQKTPEFVLECRRVKNIIVPVKLSYDFKKKVNENVYRIKGSHSLLENKRSK